MITENVVGVEQVRAVEPVARELDSQHVSQHARGDVEWWAGPQHASVSNSIECGQVCGAALPLHFETCSSSLVHVRSQIVDRTEAGSLVAQRNAIIFK